jgi:hypothetical protein
MLPSYARAFALTLGVEVPVYIVVLSAGAGVRWPSAALLALGVNVATHPVTWFSLRRLTDRAVYPYAFLGAELAVCAAEWLLLVGWSRRRPDLALLAAASVTANAASALAGLLLPGAG